MQITKVSGQIQGQKLIMTTWSQQFGKKKQQFNNYFYVKQKNLKQFQGVKCINIELDKTYLSLDNDDVYKCTIVGTAFTWHKLIKSHKKYMYQHDIPVQIKYMNDNNIKFSKKRHILYYDIQTRYIQDRPNDNQANIARAQITSIVAYSNVTNNYYIFAWHPIHTEDIYDYQISQKDNKITFMCKDQENVLLCFTEIIKQINVDIITGWFSHGYDLPYIYKRLAANQISIQSMAQGGNFWMSPTPHENQMYKFKIAGLDTVDMMQCISYMNYNLQNNKLDTAAQMILGTQHMKLKSVSWRDWEPNFFQFLEYNIRDVTILHMIDQKLHLFDFLIQLQIMANTPKLNNVLSTSRLNDYYILNKYWKKYVMPDIQHNQRQTFMGAIVIDPTKPGVHKNVAILDFASLYPTTDMWGNFSHQTFIASRETLSDTEFDQLKIMLDNQGISYVDTGYSDQLVGKQYLFLSHKQRVGVIPESLYQLYMERKRIKKLMKSTQDESQKSVFDRQQHAIKIILNSMYGAMGFPSFRFYRIQCADAITYFGRMAINYAKKYITNFSNKINHDCNEFHGVQASDTDSVHFVMGKTSVQQLQNQLKLFNNKIVQDIIKKYNPDVDSKYVLYDFQWQDTMKYMYYGESKKRYFGIKSNDQTYCHGLSLIKKDTSNMFKQMLQEISIKIVTENFSYKDLIGYYDNMINCPDYKSISIHKKITRDYHHYKKVIPGHVAAALWAIKNLNLNIKFTQPVYMFNIFTKCETDLKDNDKTTAICLRQQDFHLLKDNEKFQIDYKQIFEKQIIQPIRQFEYAEGVNQILNMWYINNPDKYVKNKKGLFVYKKYVKEPKK